MYAAEDKADYAELDVQETKDGVVVLMHDKNLKRVAKVDKNLSEAAYEDIEKLDVGSIYSEKFKGKKIPTLDQVMKAAKGKIKLDIEILLKNPMLGIGFYYNFYLKLNKIK